MNLRSPVLRFAFHSGFTLLEVMIACAIFFLCAFAILGVVTQGLAGARALQTKEPDAGLLAAALLTTNRLHLEEGVESGDFEDLYPGVYPGYSWTRESVEKYSNGLWEVTFTIVKGGRGKRAGAESRTTTYIYCPTCPPGSATKGMP